MLLVGGTSKEIDLPFGFLALPVALAVAVLMMLGATELLSISIASEFMSGP